MINNVLIKTTSATALDCSQIETVNKISIDSAEPDNTETKFLLSVDGGKWQKYSGGDWSFATEQDLTADSVLAEGNTKAELTAIPETGLASFGGKIINLAVAMHVENNADLPSISKFEILGRNSQIKKNIAFSDVLKLGKDTVGITNIEVAKTESNGGAVNVFASVQGDSDEWSDFVDFDKIPNKGKAIRFKAEFEIDSPNVSTAILNNVKIKHWQDSKTASVEGKSILISKPLTFESNVNRAHAIIHHPPTKDTDFKMYVLLGDSDTFAEMNRIATRNKNTFIEDEFEYVAENSTSNTATLKIEIIQNSGTVENEVLGTGTGKQQSFKLAHHARSETLQVIGSDNWIFKEKTDTLILTANPGSDISVSYDWIAQTTYLSAIACIFNS